MKKKILVIFLLAVLVVSCLVLTACHSCEFGEWTVTKQPTCTQDGSRERVCECGEKETEVVPATGHSYGDWTAVKDATCTEDGLELRFCGCGVTESRVIDAGHNYEAVVTEPTCLEQGYKTHTCSGCGDSYVDAQTGSIGDGVHNFQEADVCEYCGLDIADEAVFSYNMSATVDDNVRGYVVSRLDGKYDVYIKGTGAMRDYGYSSPSSPFDEDGIVNAYVENGITSIGNCAFEYCSSLTSIAIPNSVTSIGLRAFDGCSSLTNITIPSGVTSIGEYVFLSCTSLASITIPSSVISIGKAAFCNCTSLLNITIPEGVTSIGEGAFSYCTSLTNITIPSSVTSIGPWQFSNSLGLTSVTFIDPNGWYVTQTKGATSGISLILTDASQNVDYLKGAYIDYYWYKEYTEHDHVYTSIVTAPTCTQQGYTTHTCSNCSDSYVDTYIDATGHNYENNVCTLCGERKTSVGLEYTLSADKTSYIVSWVSNCSDADIVILATYNGKAVNSIGDYAFSNCSYIESITIPASITSIGDYAFEDCEGLKTVTFEQGSQLTSIGECAFARCTSLESITFKNCNILTSIGLWAFSDCTSLKEIKIPDSVTTIEGYAFYGCTNLKNITIPSKVTRIEEATFTFCASLTSITLHSNIKTIGVGAFYGCTGLVSITIPASVTSIEEAAFYDCSRLIYITFEDPNGWYCTLSQGATSGTSLTLTDASQNATYLKDYYISYYWYKAN